MVAIAKAMAIGLRRVLNPHNAKVRSIRTVNQNIMRIIIIRKDIKMVPEIESKYPNYHDRIYRILDPDSTMSTAVPTYHLMKSRRVPCKPCSLQTLQMRMILLIQKDRDRIINIVDNLIRRMSLENMWRKSIMNRRKGNHGRSSMESI